MMMVSLTPKSTDPKDRQRLSVLEETLRQLEEENGSEEDSDGYEKPVVVREWACRVLSQSPTKGAIITGGTTFRATWTVENTGSKTWPKKGVDIVFQSGAHLQDIPTTVGPGGKVTISIPMIAPKRSEVYSTRWSLKVGRTDFCTVRFIIEVK